MPIATRLTIAGNLLVNGSFDETVGLPVVDSSLQLWVDANQTASYPGTGTTWFDLSGNSNNLQFFGTQTYATNVSGTAAIYMNGTDGSYIFQTLPGTYSSNTGSGFTISFWSYISSINVTGQNLLLNFAGTSLYAPGGGPQYRWVDAPFGSIPGGGVFGSTLLADYLTQWCNTTAVVSNGQISVYKNGVFQASTSTSLGSSTSPQIRLGNSFGGRDQIGYYSNVLIYNRPLNAAEVVRNYNALAPRHNKSLVVETANTSRVMVTSSTVYASQFDEVTILGPVVDTSLQLWLDAGNPDSYSGAGTTWADISGNIINMTTNAEYTALANGSFRFNNNSATSNLSLIAGLKKTTYEGYFNDNVNFFATATPKAVGSNPTYSLQTNIINEPNSNDGEFFSVQWLGYFRPATTETYTFYLNSDDASYMWLGASAISGFTTSTALINNGLPHPPTEKFASIALTAGENYPIRIQFGESGGGDQLDFSFSTPTIAKTTNVTNRVFYSNTSNIPALNFGTRSFAVNFWMYATNWGEGRSDGIVGQKRDDSTNGWVIYNDGNAPTRINARLTLDIDFFSASNVVNNVWQNWTFVRNSTNNTVSWYLNGKLDTIQQDFSNSISDTTATFYIGYSQPWQGYFKGNLANMQIYNRALLATEVLQNFNDSSQRFGLPASEPVTVSRESVDGILSVLGEFDEWTGAPVVDSSLKLWLDAGQPASYSGTGSTWTNLISGGPNGTLSRVGVPDQFNIQNIIYYSPTYSKENGGAIQFFTYYEYVTADVNFQGSSQFTVSMWVKSFSRFSFGGSGTFFQDGDGNLFSIGNEKFAFYTEMDNNWVFSVDSPTIFNGLPRYSSTVMELDTWYNLVGVYTGTSFQMLANGQSIYTTSTNISSVTLNTETVGIARRFSTSRGVHGIVSNLQIYNRVLTADEITTNFNALRGRYGI